MTQQLHPTQVASQLQERPDVPDEDIPEIIALAEKLQEEADKDWGDVSVDELKQAARELDIQPEYIEAAIAQRANDRALAAAEEEARRGRLRKMLQGAAALVLAVVLGLSGLGLLGAGSVNRSYAQVQQAEQAVLVVLERQANLAPQLLALSGGDPGSLGDVIEDTQTSGDIEAKLRASSALGTALAEQLAAVEGADPQVLQDLSWELTGTQNRITTETRRLREAQSSHQQAASTLPGRLARTMGMAPGP